MTRQTYLICYDICDDTRLNRVHHLLQGWRIGGQKSAFECLMNDTEYLMVKQQLLAFINPDIDRLLILRIDPKQSWQKAGKSRDIPQISGSFFVF